VLYPLSYGGEDVTDCGLRTKRCGEQATAPVRLRPPPAEDVMATLAALDPTVALLATAVRDALAAAGLPSDDPALERPKDPEHGDWATTIALRVAKQAGRSPREIADALAQGLGALAEVDEVSVAGPGFVNFRLSHVAHAALVRRILAQGADFGRVPAGTQEHVNVEFVSANPTGPLHLGAGRWAATGDAIASLLEAAGHRVTREYYVNDIGEQIRRFGASILRVDRSIPLEPEDYHGDYVPGLAATLRERFGAALLEGELDDIADAVGARGVEVMRERIEGQLAGLGVVFDVWTSEGRLHADGALDAALAALRDGGHTYEADGALFLRTTDFGDDKDRVLIRSDGRPTYFASDCAYMRDKRSRADRCIYLVGADHHGYVARLKAAASCLGIDPDTVEVRIGQLVNLLRDGEAVRLSKRAGEMITLDDALDEVGADVARYHFLRQNLDTTIDMDLAVVASQSMENPVYYVQYAHARVSSLVRQADERGFDAGALEDADLSLLVHPAELALLRAMSSLPHVLVEAAELRATQRLTRYAEELAGTFHRFYAECRVLEDDADADEATRARMLAASRARYWLVIAARQVLANVLATLRVSAPERM
jgi:arginyl-tRNA synthetase